MFFPIFLLFCCWQRNNPLGYQHYLLTHQAHLLFSRGICARFHAAAVAKGKQHCVLPSERCPCLRWACPSVPLSAQHYCSDVKLPSGSEPGSAKGPPYLAVFAPVWRAMLREVRQVTELFQAFWQQAPAKAYLQQLLWIQSQGHLGLGVKSRGSYWGCDLSLSPC